MWLTVVHKLTLHNPQLNGHDDTLKELSKYTSERNIGKLGFKSRVTQSLHTLDQWDCRN